MAKKRLQKKRSSSTVRKQESEILQVTTSKTEPVRVETSKVEPVKVETSKVEPVKLDVPVDLTLYNERFQKHYDELKWLYCELYQDRDDVMTYLHDLTSNMEAFYNSRNSALKASDKKREADPDWYKRNDLVGMMMYVNNFAHTLKGLEEHLDYVEECNVNYLHLMPLLASPKGKSDGGYAADGTSPASVSADRLPLVANLFGRPLVVHKCALHEKAMKGMKNSSPPSLHFLHIGICFFLHCL